MTDLLAKRKEQSLGSFLSLVMEALYWHNHCFNHPMSTRRFYQQTKGERCILRLGWVIVCLEYHYYLYYIIYIAKNINIGFKIYVYIYIAISIYLLYINDI